VTAAGRGRVLIADDEPELLEIYGALLEKAGYQVETAGDGWAALNRLLKGQFNLVLSDISMPDMDGLSLLRAVREQDLDLPVVLMTGDPRVDTAVQAVEYGALRYLLKPIGEELLLRTVGDAVKLHRMAALKREALAHLGAREGLVGDRAGLEASFGRAVASLWMAYQPIVRVDGRLYGYEALVRTREPALPHPGALFEAAERLGRILELGRTIRDSVAASLATMPAEASVFVNLHPHELIDDALLDSALTAGARKVVLEVTERAALPDLADVQTRVRALRHRGFRIAVDDLGAGYAGLTSFATLEPEVVKLDMSLVRGVDAEPIKQRLIGSMAALCKELGILVVAEGVETEAERGTLAGLGCDLLQGFLLGRPGPLPAGQA
jgi:EAL domain-containing protein (putative c-di-GMP-specific phosphodiesterase class I)